MKKKLYILIVLMLLAGISLHAQDNILSISGGAVIPTGDNTENYDIGYKLGINFELVPLKNLGVSFNTGYSYLYSEITDYMPYFGAWIDNHMPFLEVSPKFILPTTNGRFRFYIGPTIKGTYVATRVSLYSLVNSGGTNISEQEWDEEDNSFVISLNGNIGFDVFITNRFGLGLNINYQALNLSDGTTSLDTEKYGIDNNKADIRGLEINLRLNFKL